MSKPMSNPQVEQGLYGRPYKLSPRHRRISECSEMSVLPNTKAKPLKTLKRLDNCLIV